MHNKIGILDQNASQGSAAYLASSMLFYGFWEQFKTLGGGLWLG